MTDNAERLHGFFAEAGLGFDPRVLDLAMMGYHLVGGSIEVINGHRIALFAYRTDADRVVLCAMYLGNAAANAGGEVRRHAGIDFYVYRVEGKTVVLWQEGAVTCALVADGDPEAVVSLAFAKAMRAAS
jgi:anti-sigma factor RsiW